MTNRQKMLARAEQRESRNATITRSPEFPDVYSAMTPEQQAEWIAQMKAVLNQQSNDPPCIVATPRQKAMQQQRGRQAADGYPDAPTDKFRMTCYRD
jgi:hypothetical protein